VRIETPDDVAAAMKIDKGGGSALSLEAAS
jgi:hypothetical protein